MAIITVELNLSRNVLAMHGVEECLSMKVVGLTEHR
jgi:hypothetical protein